MRVMVASLAHFLPFKSGHRVKLIVCRFASGVVLIFALAGCTHTPDQILSYCQRWAAKYVNYGAHDNPDAYRQDLVSTCMAFKRTPYDNRQYPGCFPSKEVGQPSGLI